MKQVIALTVTLLLCGSITYGADDFAITIETLPDIHQARFVDLPIRQTEGTIPMGGFDFLIHYDQTLLTFSKASLGNYLADCGWEYFTYRTGWNGNCGSGYPTGEIRLVGLAETNNGPYHPDYTCISNAPTTNEAIANLTFFVTADVNANGQFARVEFFWMDCGDNTISVPSGDTLAISHKIYNYYGTNGTDSYIDITDTETTFPTSYGAPTSCLDAFDPTTDKTPPIRMVDFYNGGIRIINKDLIDKRGDINMNDIPNEIADAVMFTNFFIEGLSAFGSHIDGSIAASDITADGAALTVADLVYLVRVINGDAQPYPRPIPDAHFYAQCDGHTVTINTDINAGAALFTFICTGEVGTPTINTNMNIKSGFDKDNRLKVLVYSLGSESIGSDTRLTIPVVDGMATLIEVEAATYNGAALESTIKNTIREFAVYQNYPNPFNPTTTISFDLDIASSWTVNIYNITGQKVIDFSGKSEPGPVSVNWNATDSNNHSVASGIYFYKVSVGKNAVTKKMVLIK